MIFTPIRIKTRAISAITKPRRVKNAINFFCKVNHFFLDLLLPTNQSTCFQSARPINQSINNSKPLIHSVTQWKHSVTPCLPAGRCVQRIFNKTAPNFPLPTSDFRLRASCFVLRTSITQSSNRSRQ